MGQDLNAVLSDQQSQQVFHLSTPRQKLWFTSQHFIIVWKGLKSFRSGRSASFPIAFVSFLLTQIVKPYYRHYWHSFATHGFTGFHRPEFCRHLFNGKWKFVMGTLRKWARKIPSRKALTSGKAKQFAECKWMCFLMNSIHEVFNTLKKVVKFLIPLTQQIRSPYCALILLVLYNY